MSFLVLLREYDGSIRPSDMVFNSMGIWARVLDLPMDMMNRAYGELIGDWIGKYIFVEVDEDGFAWGKELRIRVAVRVDQPLMRGVNLKSSDDEVEGKWFDIKYEKIPHFCFDCGCLVHPAEGCQAEKDDVKQWGEWLRASPRRNQRAASTAHPSVSLGSYSTRSSNSEVRGRGGISVRIFQREGTCEMSLHTLAHHARAEVSRGGRRAMSLAQANGRGRGRMLSKKSMLREGERLGRTRLVLSRGDRGHYLGIPIRPFPKYHWVWGVGRGALNRCGCRYLCRLSAKGVLSQRRRGSARTQYSTGWITLQLIPRDSG
jgi:hypothetical protein